MAKLIEKIISKANELYHKDGEVEVDLGQSGEGLSYPGSPQVDTESQMKKAIKENGGCYVKAWVWVDYESLKGEG